MSFIIHRSLTLVLCWATLGHMAHRSKFFFDCDGVLCNFARDAVSLFGIHYSDVEMECTSWNALETVISRRNGMKESEIWNQIAGAGYKFWREMSHTWFLNSMIDLMEALHEADVEVYVLTSPMKDASNAKGRMKWIQDHLPSFIYNRRRVIFGHCKHVCAGPNHYLIDDRPKNLRDWRKHGGVAIKSVQPWNTTDFTREKQVEFVSKINELTNRVRICNNFGIHQG